MKKLIFILAVLLLASQNLFSQETERERNVTIQLNPLLWFVDVFASDDESVLFAIDLESQFKITNSVNISVELSFLYGDDKYSYHDVNGYYREIFFKRIYQAGIKPMFVYRPFETGLKGFFLGVSPSVGILHVENGNIKQLFTELGFGFDLGYKWIFRGGFTMQVGGGVSKTFSIPDGSKQYLSINSDGSIPTTHTNVQIFGFKLGYSF